MMLLFWGGLIALAAVIIRAITGDRSQGGNYPSGTPKTPRQILEERYARGEIDKKEFEAIRDDLTA